MGRFASVAGHLLMPLAVIAVFFAALYYRTEVPTGVWNILPLLFYVLCVVAVGISWHFNRSRFIFIVVPLAVLFWAMSTVGEPYAAQLRMLASLVIPLHLLLFLFLKERGLFSLWGMLRLGFVVAEIAVAAYVVVKGKADLSGLMQLHVFDKALTGWTPLCDLSLLVGLSVVLLFLLLAFVHHLVIYHTAFAGIFFLMMAGLHYGAQSAYAAAAYAGVVLLVFGVLLKESYRLAFYDELTGLPGRRALIEEMAKLGRKYSLAMVDIDHFKKFNDTYGHDTGDEVLKMVAAKLAGVGGGGKAYRYGGEEFTVLFPSKALGESYSQMDIIREKIAKTAFSIRGTKGKKAGKGGTVTIHISSGIVEKSAGDKDPMAVMKRADNALYKAKKQGRNKVVKA